MNTGTKSHRQHWGLTVTFVGFWLTAIILMVLDHINDPYDPNWVGTDRYGHNTPQTLQLVAAATVLELILALAIMRPWSANRSIGRVLLALGLFLPWGAVSLVMVMHAGGIAIIRFSWIAIVTLILFVYLVRSIAGHMQPLKVKVKARE